MQKMAQRRFRFLRCICFKPVQMWDLQLLFNLFVTNPTISILHVFHTSFIVLNIIKARSRVSDWS